MLCPLFAAYARYEPSEKRRAWFLSLITASFVAPRSLYFHASLIFPFDEAAMYQSNLQADWNVGLFVAFLLADTCLGLIYYRSCFGLLEGWAHHAFYLAYFLFLFLKGFTVGASVSFPLEVPVMFLALGHCFPRARTDLLFGATFFAFRIGFHAVVLYQFRHTRFTPVIAGTLALHAHWFHKWTLGQRKRWRRKRQSSDETISKLQ